ncbi:MAG: response regulator [Sphingomonadales bacterium]
MNELTMASQHHSKPYDGHDRILVVDDQPEVRQAAVRLLKALGHATVEADKASAALEILERDDHFDLLFTDIVMPGSMNGVDLALEVRRRHPAMPILFTSGYVEPELIQRHAGDLHAELLKKPYGKAELAQMLDRVLPH